MKTKLFTVLLLSFSILSTNCTRVDSRVEFEKSLDYFIQKPSSEVLRIFGKENISFKNEGATASGAELTLMTYVDRYKLGNTDYICSIRFKMEQGIDKVIDWDYEGNGCF